jgi:crossover junction endodeoxyribonuclease RuvC
MAGMTTILGVDPGLSGAIAAVRDGRLLRVDDMPTEATGSAGRIKRRVAAATLHWLIREIRADHDDLIAVVESVASRPGQGVAGMFSLGDSAGALRGVLQASLVRVEFVTPAAWKRAMKLNADKGLARTLASQMWPEHARRFARVCDDGRAEAALIAAYGWELWG